MKDYESAVRMMSLTGCDAVAIGRAARGNPWIFRELNETDRIRRSGTFGGEYSKPSAEEIIDMIERHAKALIDYKGEYTGIREMRKHASWYLAGMKHAARIRGRLNEAETLEEFTKLLTELREKNRE